MSHNGPSKEWILGKKRERDFSKSLHFERRQDIKIVQVFVSLCRAWNNKHLPFIWLDTKIHVQIDIKFGSWQQRTFAFI